MRTPLASPSCGPGGPCVEVPTLDLDEGTAALQAAIEASLGDDMKRRLQSSLQDTKKDLRTESVEGGRDPKRVRLQSSSERSEEEGASNDLNKEKPYAESPPRETLDKRPQSVTEDHGCNTAGVPAEGAHGGVDVADSKPVHYEFDGLLDHESLLESLYAAQGISLRAQQEKAMQVLAEVGLRALDLGVKNLDEEGQELINQCFYLSIARSYLGNAAYEEVLSTALCLKRTVEACVLSQHPEWATDDTRLGENAMAFADFLPIAMGAKPASLIAHLAVLILDSTQGHAEVYLGPLYPKQETILSVSEREKLERDLVLLCYTPGHYKALVQDDALGSKPAWTYYELKGLLDQRGVRCIETSDFD